MENNLNIGNNGRLRDRKGRNSPPSQNTNVVVPQYQRSYAWEDRHVIDFLDNIERAVKGEMPEYFLGSVVLAEGEAKGRPEVVDGQQRLATATILIARVRDHFASATDKDKSHNIDSQFLMSRELRSDGDIQKLELNKHDNDFFLKTVLRLRRTCRFLNETHTAPFRKRSSYADSVFKSSLRTRAQTKS